jgi:hypothetical protein
MSGGLALKGRSEETTPASLLISVLVVASPSPSRERKESALAGHVTLCELIRISRVRDISREHSRVYPTDIQSAIDMRECVD